MTLFTDCPAGEADEDGNAQFWFFLFRHGLPQEEFALTASMDDGVSLTDGLVLHYDGTVLGGVLKDQIDASGVADLDLHDVEIVPGRLTDTQALRFNGTSAYGVSRVHIDAVELQTFSLCVWLRTTGAVTPGGAGSFGRLVSYYPRGESRSFNGDGNYYGWILEHLSDTAYKIHFMPPGTGPEGSDVLDGQWHHCVVLFNPRAPYQIYIDGILRAEVDYTQSDWAPDYTEYVNRLYLGSLGDFDSFGFYHGDLGDIRVYDRILNGDEIQALFQTT